jgi:hypothetical protein
VKRYLLLLLCMSSLKLFAATHASLVLSRAMALSSQGEISDPELVGELKKMVQDTSLSSERRLEAAYLFTFVPSGVDDDTRRSAIELAFADPRAEKVLGRDAITRLYRVKGDLAYDQAKFETAIEAYGQVRRRVKRGDPFAEYAIIRQGWCYLNADQGGKAFDLWLSEIKERLPHQEKPISLSLFHGLGQAFSENAHRTSDDAEALAELSLDAEQKEAVAKGLADGLGYLRSTDAIARWWKSLEGLPWRQEIADRIEETGTALGKRACELLPLVVESNPKGKEEGKSSSRLLETCADAYYRREPGTQKAAKWMRQIFAQMDLKGDNRRPRYQFYRFEKDKPAACTEGIHWLGEQNGRESLTVSVKEVTELCGQSVRNNDSEAVAKLAREVLSLGDQDKAGFRSADDPALYVVNTLLKRPDFASSLSTELMNHSSKFQGSLLPQLTAEALVGTNQLSKAEKVRAQFGRGATEQSVWTDLRTRKVQEFIEAGKWGEARSFIDGECPLKDGNSSCLPLWLWLLSKEASRSEKREQVKTEVSQVLKANSMRGEALSQWVDLAVTLELWDAAWSGVRRLDAESEKKSLISDRLEMLLLDAVTSNKIVAKPEEIAALHDAKLKKIFSFAANVKEKPVADLELPRNSPLVPDLRFVQAVDKKSKSVLRPRKEPVEELSAWVDFLDGNTKGLRRRRWVSRALYGRGVESMERFCMSAGSRLRELPPSKQMPGDDWKKLVSLLEKRLSECKEWVQSAKNEMSSGPDQKGAVGE